MKNKLRTIIIFLFLTSVNYTAQENFQIIKNGIELRTDSLLVRVQFYNHNIVRIIKWIEKGSPEKNSLSVIMNEFPEINIKLLTNEQGLSISSELLNLFIDSKSGSITFKDKNSKTLLTEFKTVPFVSVEYFGDKGFTVQQKFKLSADEGIYGLGQHQSGYFNYRGKKVLLSQSNTEASSSFLTSTNNYGILWDNYSKTVFEDNENGASLWSEVADNIDYYFVNGDSFDEIIAGYRRLTGKAPMYGKHAYGYWQSKEHYDTQNELMTVAKKYRALKIPIDNMIQDWDYWNGAQNWSGMFFDKTLFPAPKEMCDSLHDMNYRIIISIWPALGPNTEIYAEMKKNNFLYKPVGWAGFKYYDAFNPDANILYWKYLKDGIYSKGLDGWWIDSTEPDVVNAMTKESSEYELKKMGRNFLGSWARYINAFSLVMTNDLYKFWREETSDRRAYILTRSTFTGQQRNATTTWSGDIGASWDIYRKQISAGTNHSMSGIPYWTFDIGAFVLGAYGGVFMNGGKDPAYQELYTRMFQLGAFSPIFRSHGSETPREIWEMGEFVTPLIKIGNLRYRLMPYIYSLAWKITNDDYTIMRGLPMDFPADKNTYNIDDQFMFGPSILVSPVTEFMYHNPPRQSILIEGNHFKNKKDNPGLDAKYYFDADRKNLSRESIDEKINLFWYTGRPEYATDSTFAVTWEGKLIPGETGKHQFHLLSYDPKRIFINGKQLKIVYKSVEEYLEPIDLEVGKEYDFKLELENKSTGAAKMQLHWKTPSIFAEEQETVRKDKLRKLYLPAGCNWYNFWTGEKIGGGEFLTTYAPIDIVPLFVREGSIIPMCPFLQYSTEKPADPIELRIYPGANGKFTLYEDENDNYNYEKGIYSTIDFIWDDINRILTVEEHIGEFPGMLKERTLNIILVSDNHGTGVEISSNFDKTVKYTGERMSIKF